MTTVSREDAPTTNERSRRSWCARLKGNGRGQCENNSTERDRHSSYIPYLCGWTGHDLHDVTVAIARPTGQPAPPTTTRPHVTWSQPTARMRLVAVENAGFKAACAVSGTGCRGRRRVHGLGARVGQSIGGDAGCCLPASLWAGRVQVCCAFGLGACESR